MNINEIAEELKEKYPEMEITVAEDLVKSNKKQPYARELTKEDLKKMGVVDIDFNKQIVYGKNGPLKHYRDKRGRLTVQLYDVDENGNRIKIPAIRKYKKINGYTCEYNGYVNKPRIIRLYKVLWVWKYDKVQKDHVIDYKAKHNTRRRNSLKSSKCYIKAKK